MTRQIEAAENVIARLFSEKPEALSSVNNIVNREINGKTIKVGVFLLDYEIIKHLGIEMNGDDRKRTGGKLLIALVADNQNTLIGGFKIPENIQNLGEGSERWKARAEAAADLFIQKLKAVEADVNANGA